jgi:hypothetical protein
MRRLLLIDYYTMIIQKNLLILLIVRIVYSVSGVIQAVNPNIQTGKKEKI